MILYVYYCSEHGLKNVRLPMKHDPPQCDECGKTMTRVYVPVPVHYKTAGFTKGKQDG
jgi:predicted nucleic acid-binding Zn ribbon protein